MKIAIIGGGISGITSALICSPHAQVTLYEKEPQLGGHANTVTAKTPQGDVAVDTGFMVCNPPRYPTLMALFAYLGVQTVPTTMSFSVTLPVASGRGFCFSSSLSGLFAQRGNIFRPSFYYFLYELVRFNSLAKQFLASADLTNTETETLGAFISDHRFSHTFTEQYLYPMLGAIWSSGTSTIVDFPARATFQFLDNHQLLSVLAPAKWHTVPHGSRTYVAASEIQMRAAGVDVRLSAEVKRIARTETGVAIHSKKESSECTETYDYVIFATHADTTLALLSDATGTERSVLGSFTYSTNETYLHKNTSYMPPYTSAWAAWNYRAQPNEGTAPTVSITYNMNVLQHINPHTPLFVTLNPETPIPKEDVYAHITYTHPHYSTETLAAQKRLGEIQNKNRTVYTGAHWGYGFHEDGAVSAVNACALLGFTPPWTHTS